MRCRGSDRAILFFLWFAALSCGVGCGASCAEGARPRSALHASGRAGPVVAEIPTRANSAPATGRGDAHAARLERAFVKRMTVWMRPDGSPVLTKHCRQGPVDCRQRLATFARLVVRSAHQHDLDPFLLGALAVHESGLNPAALGQRGEAGLVQLHPRGAGVDVRYVLDESYRDRCQRRLDACQGPVLDRGAATLADHISRCGGVEQGLSAYASGRCGFRGAHPQRVLAERDRLRGLAAR